MGRLAVCFLGFALCLVAQFNPSGGHQPGGFTPAPAASGPVYSATGLGSAQNPSTGTTISVSGVSIPAGRTVILHGSWCQDTGCGGATAVNDLTSLTCTGETGVRKVFNNISDSPGITNLGVTQYIIPNSVGGIEQCTFTLSGANCSGCAYAAIVVTLANSAYTWDVCGIGFNSSSLTTTATTAGNGQAGNLDCTVANGNQHGSNELLVSFAVMSGTLTTPSGFTVSNNNNYSAGFGDAWKVGGTAGGTSSVTWSHSTNTWGVVMISAFY